MGSDFRWCRNWFGVGKIKGRGGDEGGEGEQFALSQNREGEEIGRAHV